MVGAGIRRGGQMKAVFRNSGLYVTLGLMILSFAACADTGRVQDVSPGVKGNMVVSMTVSSYQFDPSVIQVDRTGDLIIRAHNVATSDHNITVKDPQEKVIASVDLPAGKTVSVNVELKTPGTYQFFCNKFMHASFGMKGEIRVAPTP
jgi:plastocyanin